MERQTVKNTLTDPVWKKEQKHGRPPKAPESRGDGLALGRAGVHTS